MRVMYLGGSRQRPKHQYLILHDDNASGQRFQERQPSRFCKAMSSINESDVINRVHIIDMIDTIERVDESEKSEKLE